MCSSASDKVSARHECSAKGAEHLRIAAITPFTTIDYPGKLAAVAFVQGCPWKCLYCHNPWMQSREYAVGLEHSDWGALTELIQRRKGLLDAVVFSGGEPCLDPALASAVRWVKQQGMLVGIHTSGAYPSHLADVIDQVDWIGLDVKGPPEDVKLFDRITGRSGSVNHFLESFRIIRRCGIEFEARTTAHPDFLSEEKIFEIAQWLVGQGVQTFALQIFRPAPGVDMSLERVDASYPSPDLIAELGQMFKSFTLRRE